MKLKNADFVENCKPLSTQCICTFVPFLIKLQKSHVKLIITGKCEKYTFYSYATKISVNIKSQNFATQNSELKVGLCVSLVFFSHCW